MNNKNEIAPTNEIVGAILQTHADDLGLANFKSSPQAFLQDQGVALADVDIAVVENESNMVHLCLPYYDSFADISSESITDSDLSDVAGGEILIGGTIGVIAGFAGTSGAIAGAVVGGLIGATVGGVVTAVVVGREASRQAEQGQNLDGSPK